jgi:cell division protein ZapA (FtsZ GTPase activity inhibitor)
VSEASQHVVTVTIAGEEYTLRAMVSPEHALNCAALVDRAVRDVQQQSSLVHPQKAAILAALTLADQLLQARADTESVRQDGAQVARQLAEEVERRLAGG